MHPAYVRLHGVAGCTGKLQNSVHSFCQLTITNPLRSLFSSAMDADEHGQAYASHLMPHDSVSSRTSRRESKRRSAGVGASTGLSGGPIDSITTMMRRMSSSGSSHVAHPPGSPTHYTMGMGMSIPTSGLITSLPGAAHFSGGTSVRSINIVA
jgi:hypothetical protein